MKVAYLILAHSDPEGLKKLVERLACHGDIYIHINAKNDVVPFEESLSKCECDTSRIRFASKRERINWAGYSIVKATFKLLDDALKIDKYDRVTLITGQDYPIVPEEELLKFYEEHKDTNYITGKECTGESNKELKYFDYRDVRYIHLFLKAFIHPLQERFSVLQRKDYVRSNGRIYTVYGISPKWSVTGQAAGYLLKFYNENRTFNRFFATRHAADDYYVATVLFNSELKGTIDNKTSFFWLKFLPNDGGTKILDESDIDNIRNTEALFARKFDSRISEKLYGMLETGDKTMNH